MYIIIIGCGKVGSELARLLANAGHNVVVIDKDPAAFKRLGVDFNGLTTTGNGFDVDLLKEVGVEQADVFCTVTDNDNANIMSGQVAKKIFHIPKVITRINDPQYAQVYRELEIDVVNSTTLLVAMIRNKITESKFSSFFLEDGRIDVIEVAADERTIGKTVEELNIPGEFSIVALLRQKSQLRLVSPRETIGREDLLFGVVKIDSLAKVKKHLGLK